MLVLDATPESFYHYIIKTPPTTIAANPNGAIRQKFRVQFRRELTPLICVAGFCLTRRQAFSGRP